MLRAENTSRMLAKHARKISKRITRSFNAGAFIRALSTPSGDADRDWRSVSNRSFCSSRTSMTGRARNLLCFVFLLISLGKSNGDFHLAIPAPPLIMAAVLLSLPRCRSARIVSRRIIIAAARARSPPSFRSSLLRFCHSHPRQRAAFFRRVAQSVRCTPRVFVTVRNISHDVTEPRIARARC